jgi:sugar-specific transcriptional regulator TrmB
MEQHESDIETLHRLGLTILEAKVYSTIVMTENGYVKGIARSLNIAKCEVYRAISSLEKMGLVEKMLTIPTTFKAIPIKETAQILLQGKTAEYAELQKETKKLVSNLHGANPKINPQEEKEQNICISDGKTVGKRLVYQLSSSKKSFETISTWEVCRNMLSRHSDDLGLLMKNKVKVRILTDKLRKDEHMPKFLVNLQKNPYFEIKYYKNQLAIKMAIRDKEEVNVCFSATKGAPNIWSDNPLFAQIVTNCFEYMWNESEKVE